ncbi:MAG: sensor histidine kinase [Clostridia bacterium]|jgi:two-component system sensor histidine kinase YesM|nr:sensor histidine kinase [Clostridia bacterium]
MIKKIMAEKKKLNRMFYYLKEISIRNKIVVYMSLFMVLAFSILTGYSYRKSYENIVQNTYNTLLNVTKQNSRNLNDIFNIIDNTAIGFASTEIMSKWLNDSSYLNVDAPDFFIKKDKLSTQIRTSLLFNNAWELKLITTVSIFIDGTYIDSIYIQPVPIENIKKQVIRANEYIEKNRLYEEGRLPTLYDGTIYHAKKLLNPQNPKKTVTFLVGTKQSLIAKKYEELVYSGEIAGYVINKQGTILSSSNQAVIGQKVDSEMIKAIDYKRIRQIKIKDKQYVAAYQPIRDNGLIFVVVVPKSSIVHQTIESMKSYMAMYLLIVASLIAGGLMVAIRSTAFLKDLAICISSIRQKNYDSEMPKYNDKGLDNLSNTFNSMTREIKYLIKDTYEKQLLLKDMQIKFLQHQMNPHFLFNVLLTIQMKAKFSQDESIYKMVNSLTALLRAGIYTEKDSKVTLKQELEYVEFYLYLQKVRFEDRMDYTIQIEDKGLLNCYIPKLCIEPITENAVIYGIENKVDCGHITIKIYQEKEDLWIEVIDNGTGFDTEKLLQEVSESREAETPKHSRIGINNTNERIKLIYGMKYGLEINSIIGEGTVVKIHLPIDKERVPYV